VCLLKLLFLAMKLIEICSFARCTSNFCTFFTFTFSNFFTSNFEIFWFVVSYGKESRHEDFEIVFICIFGLVF